MVLGVAAMADVVLGLLVGTLFGLGRAAPPLVMALAGMDEDSYVRTLDWINLRSRAVRQLSAAATALVAVGVLTGWQEWSI